MLQYDVMKYVSHAAVSYGALLAYDCLVEDYKLDGGFAMSDAYSFAIASFVSDLSYDLLSSALPYLNDGHFTGMVARPLINGIIYMYLFDYMTNQKYPSGRDSSRAFVIGAFGSLLSSYIQNPLLGLFGIKSY